MLHALVLAVTCIVLSSGTVEKSRVENQQILESSIKIKEYPEILKHNSFLKIVYVCNNDSFVLVRVEIEGLTKPEVSVFKKTIRCNGGLTHKNVRIHLSKHLSYSPSQKNNYRHFPIKAYIRAWIAPEKYNKLLYKIAKTKTEVVVKVPHPYDRPPMPETECLVWWKRFVRQSFHAPVCSIEPETVRILSYPLVLSGERVGLVKKLETYKDLELLKDYDQDWKSSSFTIIMWVFIVDYCPNSLLCSLLHHASWDDNRYSPLFLINRKGQLHVETFKKSGSSVAFLSFNSLPKNTWTQLIISCHNSKEIRVDIASAPKFEKTFFIQIDLPEGTYFEDTMGVVYFGGSDLHYAFKGYLGDVTWHRRKVVPVDRIPSKSHPMFQLKLFEQDTKCAAYRTKASFYWTGLVEKYRSWKDLRRTCKNSKKDVNKFLFISKPFLPQCSVFHNPTFPKQYAFVASYMKKLVLKKTHLNTQELSSSLIEEVFSRIKQIGLSQMPYIVSLLKQSSCYSNPEAAYILATIYNYGLSVPVDEMQAQSYIMKSCLQLNRLSLLSMANKHTLGIDGIPLDYEQAYVYYMTAAVLTLEDLRSHRDEDTLTEFVRLTDEKSVEMQHGEDGHVFEWFKQQAVRGMHGAQKRMASLLYWGAKGVKRNITTASNYYQQAAQTGNPASMHDLAIILLKGHGVKKNITRAVELLQEGASKNYSRSCNTLGWYFMEIEKNYTQAAYYLEKAFQLGDPDAGHNLAYMLLSAKYPGVNRVERRMAWEFASQAALRGNLESGLLVSKYNMIGHVRIVRDTHLSIVWARHLSEKNPAIGRLLSDGVKNYRSRNWQASLFFYLLAANSGTEEANFNLAFLCEENHEYLSSNMEKECVFRHYNFSTLRSDKNDNSYAWLKMADRFYQLDNITMATNTYANAALNGNPQGLFNLALLVEEGRKISDDTWKSLSVPFNVSRNHLLLLHHIYASCMNSKNHDAYLPCLLALVRIKLQLWWTSYGLFFLVSILGIACF